jgi:nucleotide-binding universal stress UspA family protein
MFQRLLIPVDGSAASLQAIDVATRLAGPQGPLHVTVAVAISPLSAEESDYRAEYLEPHNAWLRTEAQRIADRAIEPFRRKGAKCATKILEGKPISAVLAKEAASGQYDLVVMSSRGMGQQQDRLRYLGSVTEHVIRRVSVPVLVVPAEDTGEED